MKKPDRNTLIDDNFDLNTLFTKIKKGREYNVDLDIDEFIEKLQELKSKGYEKISLELVWTDYEDAHIEFFTTQKRKMMDEEFQIAQTEYNDWMIEKEKHIRYKEEQEKLERKRAKATALRQYNEAKEKYGF